MGFGFTKTLMCIGKEVYLNDNILLIAISNEHYNEDD
jgi:hypothetical protein